MEDGVSHQTPLPATMGEEERVVRLDAAHIPSLLPRLAEYGAHGLRTRSLLLLLHRLPVPGPVEIFSTVSEQGSSDAVLLTVLRPSERLAVLDVCGREDAASRRQLDRLLRSPQLGDLWRTPIRAENVPVGLADVLVAAAADHGHRVTFTDVVLRLFQRPAGQPLPPLLTASQPGPVSVRPLQQRHLATVRARWPFAAQCPDTDAMLREAAAAGLTAGVFLTDSADDQPVAWHLVNAHCGTIGFGYTEPEHRRRRLSGLALAHLVATCERRGIPCLAHIEEDNIPAIRVTHKLGFVPEHRVIWRNFAPVVDSSNAA